MSESTTAYIQMFLPLILIFVALWFFMIRPQKKRDNETKQMRNSLQEGDEIVTIGGIVGKVLNVKEDSVVVYVGSDKTKVEFKKWAIGEVTKRSERPAAKSEQTNAEPAEEESKKKKIKRLSRKDDADQNPLEGDN